MSNKKWTKDDVKFLEENYGSMSLENMASHLSRSPMAVRLYVLRHRLDDKHQVVKENRLKKLLEYRFRHLEDFAPRRFFFTETGINHHRKGISGSGGLFQLACSGSVRFPSAKSFRPINIIGYENQLRLY